MKLCVAQPIFAPDDNQLEKNLTSLRSLKNIKNAHFYFSGWAKYPQYWDEIDKVINELNPKMYLKQDENYGKSYNINLLTLDLKDYDILLTMDSDIIFKDGIDYYKEISKISNMNNLGIISLNQEYANCHMTNHLNKEMKFSGHRFVYNNDAGGIAGGCVIIDFNFWKDIDGYRVMGVYAGDDAFLFLDARDKKKRFAMCETVSVIHPGETDGKYQEWKGMVCRRDTHGSVREDLTDQIKESMDFWKDH